MRMRFIIIVLFLSLFSLLCDWLVRTTESDERWDRQAMYRTVVTLNHSAVIKELMQVSPATVKDALCMTPLRCIRSKLNANNINISETYHHQSVVYKGPPFSVLRSWFAGRKGVRPPVKIFILADPA